MEYHQDSFLAGIAVGRRLKGWACGGDLALNMGNTGNTGGRVLFASVCLIPLELLLER